MWKPNKKKIVTDKIKVNLNKEKCIQLVAFKILNFIISYKKKTFCLNKFPEN